MEDGAPLIVYGRHEYQSCRFYVFLLFLLFFLITPRISTVIGLVTLRFNNGRPNQGDSRAIISFIYRSSSNCHNLSFAASQLR